MIPAALLLMMQQGASIVAFWLLFLDSPDPLLQQRGVAVHSQVELDSGQPHLVHGGVLGRDQVLVLGHLHGEDN